MAQNVRLSQNRRENNYKNTLSTLPASLCVKRSERPGKGYEVWSLKPISVSTRFGPYEGKLEEGSSRQLSGGFQWKVKVKESLMTLDGGEEKGSNWLRYVNYARNKEEQNLVALQLRQSCVYYVACKDIPANTQLFVWYRDKPLEKRNNQSEDMPYEKSFLETRATKHFTVTKNMGAENIDQSVENACSLTQPSTQISIETLTGRLNRPTPPSEYLSLYPSVYTFAQEINLETLVGINNGSLFNANEQCKELVTQLGNTFITTYKLHECGICHKSYVTMFHLKEHMRWYHTGIRFHDANEECMKQVSQLEINRRYECEICHKTYAKKSSVKEHMMDHTGEKPFECSVCKKRFKRSSSLREHSISHSNLKPFECEICHKKYARKEYAIEHMMDHTGEKPYGCYVCKKRFKRSSHLRLHSISHTTLRPFQCDICQAKFKSAKWLKLHKLRHSGERPFECSVCNKRYFEKKNLTEHMTLHTGEKRFECQVCHKKFRKSVCLRIHRNIHTKEKVYKCDVCNRQFLNPSAIRTHKRIHTGEKPYECSVCHRRFAFYSPFCTHMKIHAEKKSHECEICHDTFTTRDTSNGCCTQRPCHCKVCNNEYTRYDDFLKHKLTHPKTSQLETKNTEASQ